MYFNPSTLRPSEILPQLNKTFCNTHCALVYRNTHRPAELRVASAIKGTITRKRLIAEGKLPPWQKLSPETRKKLSDAKKIVCNQPEFKNRMSNVPCNIPGTPEYDAKQKKISATRIERHIMPSEDQVERWKQQMAKWVAENGHPLKGFKFTDEQRKKMSIAHIGLQAGEKHPNWKGGISEEGYGNGWSVARKLIVRERDHYICQLCFVNLIKEIIRSSVHHIDYNKKHCTFDNLILLCHRCNCRVNYNRDYWTLHFQAIMRTKEMIEANSKLPLAHLSKANRK